MTPWHLRERVSRWLTKKLTGIDFDALEMIEPEPPPPSERVVVMPADAPFLGADAMEMLAQPKASSPAPVPELPLVGSAEERLARARPRW